MPTRPLHPLAHSISASNNDFDAILGTTYSHRSPTPSSDNSRAPTPLPEKPEAALLPPEEGGSKWERAASTSPARRPDSLDAEAQSPVKRRDTYDELASTEKEIREDKRHRQHAFLAVALLIVILVVIPLALVISRSKAFNN
ncbi:hypothetical protein Tdes44962_MAKER03482 [Teratosphaeria destructans]|uniref:Uncharacterized protein n=1 Tax=Teratosphaeria destructans TaxID=418781 RepID=A0A9W7SPW8_9PEZI|nr:hypothetical protein Tdes44962_MAKER03482 [Teratosphaeria destructans]